MTIDNIKFMLKDGREAMITNPNPDEAADMLRLVAQFSRETIFLLSYPEEIEEYTLEKEWQFLAERNASPDAAMLTCVVDGKMVGNCAITFETKIKTRHRGSVAIALLKEYWEQGIGTKMFEEMFRLAYRRGGISQLELDYVEGDVRARALYEKMGFRITGVKPNAIRLKDGTLLNEYMMVKQFDNQNLEVR